MDGITFQQLVTPAGALVAATAIKLLVDLVKAVAPRIDAAVSGALLAFVLSGVLYLAAALSLPSLGVHLDANGYLNIVLVWLTAAAGAVGITSAITHARDASSSAAVLLTEPIRIEGRTGMIGEPPKYANAFRSPSTEEPPGP
jgi:hypothetical protein